MPRWRCGPGGCRRPRAWSPPCPSRWSPRSPATRLAAGSRLPSPPISASRGSGPGSASPRSCSASSPGPAERSGCPAWSARPGPRTSCSAAGWSARPRRCRSAWWTRWCRTIRSTRRPWTWCSASAGHRRRPRRRPGHRPGDRARAVRRAVRHRGPEGRHAQLPGKRPRQSHLHRPLRSAPFPVWRCAPRARSPSRSRPCPPPSALPSSGRRLRT